MDHHDTSSPVSVVMSIITYAVLQHPFISFVPAGGHIDTVIDSVIKGVFAIIVALITNEVIKKRNKK